MSGFPRVVVFKRERENKSKWKEPFFTYLLFCLSNISLFSLFLLVFPKCFCRWLSHSFSLSKHEKAENHFLGGSFFRLFAGTRAFFPEHGKQREKEIHEMQKKRKKEGRERKRERQREKNDGKNHLHL